MKKLLLAATVVAVAVTAQAAQDPEAVFNRTCGACHDGQLPMAPKKGDHAAWEPAAGQGHADPGPACDQRIQRHAARGLCTDCSAEDYQATIQWMVKK